MNATELQTLFEEIKLHCEWMEKRWGAMSGKAGGEKCTLLKRWSVTLCLVTYDDASSALQEILDRQVPLDLRTWAPKIRDRALRIAREHSEAKTLRDEQARRESPPEPAPPDTTQYERMRRDEPEQFEREMECKRAAIRRGRAGGCSMRGIIALLEALGEDPHKPESEEARKLRHARSASPYRRSFGP